MPTYEYECPSCGEWFEKFLSITSSDDPQTCSCGSVGEKRISPPNFILKGDGWTGKELKVNGQMMKRRQKVLERQSVREREANIHLAPNVAGERVDTWSEAQKLARSKGLDSSSYDPLVRKEKSK